MSMTQQYYFHFNFVGRRMSHLRYLCLYAYSPAFFLHRIENFRTLELKISNLDLDTLL
jgi:hypothetical protein